MNTMNPGIAAFATPLGTCALRWTEAGIASVRLPSAKTATVPNLTDGVDVPERVRAAIVGIVAVLGGADTDLRFVALDERGIEPFRHEVYAATRAIRPGTTATYGDIARAIGRPDGARDVGAALARNPYPIVVPCHRVLGANGKLTGFSAPGGLETKRRMLELEGAPGFGQQLLFGQPVSEPGRALDQLGDHRRSSGGSVGLDRERGRRSVDLLRDRGGDHLGR
jgi:methylated-DNA-[protein]-cysteine S-methyltransferase